MICNNCTKAMDIPTRVNSIVVGSVAPEEVTVYIESAKGRLQAQNVSTEGDPVTITTTSGTTDVGSFIDGMTYQIWATEQGASIDDLLTITIDGEEYSCLRFKARFAVEDSGSTFIEDEIDEITLKVE